MTTDSETSEAKADVLPDAKGLLDDAFGGQNRPRRRRRSSEETEEEATAGSPAIEPRAETSPSGGADADSTDLHYSTEDKTSVGLPDPDAPSTTSVQLTGQLHRRFRRYQQRERTRTGKEPSNVEVVLAALNACYGRYGELWAKSQRQQVDSTKPFGRAVPGRTSGTSRGRYQVSIRTTAGELAQIDAFKAKHAGAKVDRSSFLVVMLDEFLPGGGEASNQ
jgi:hypothetical protein